MRWRPLLSLALLSTIVFVFGGIWWSLGDSTDHGYPDLEPSAGMMLAAAAQEPSLQKPEGVGLGLLGAAPASRALSGRLGVLQGRCRTHRNQGALPGVLVEFLWQGESLAEATSDDHGEFAVDLASSKFDQVRVRAPEGWWCFEQGFKRDRYVLQLAPHSVGPVRGILINSETKEPLAQYVVRIRDQNGWSETLASDREGRVDSDVYFVKGELQLLAQAEETGGKYSGWVIGTLDHVPQGANPPRTSIEVRSGPTYQLQLDNPGRVPLGNLQAYITSAARIGRVVETTGRAVRVRRGEMPWVRFPGAYSIPAQPFLVITDSGGSWLGSA
ncbi:MAG: hypothetical protein ACI9F9_002724, partial [Candidatus Paceibacteria bacterium]